MTPEPPHAPIRRISMRTAPAALLLLALLAACGNEAGDDGSVVGEEPEPTTAPTGPPWPAFPHDDYTFVFSRTCFCPERGVRIKVTVRGGEAVDATYVAGVEGSDTVEPGSPATEEWHLITLDDVIASANRDDVARVDVQWPAGQEYPDRVWVDEDEMTVDEELGYDIYRVVVDE